MDVFIHKNNLIQYLNRPMQLVPLIIRLHEYYKCFFQYFIDARWPRGGGGACPGADALLKQELLGATAAAATTTTATAAAATASAEIRCQK